MCMKDVFSHSGKKSATPTNVGMTLAIINRLNNRENEKLKLNRYIPGKKPPALPSPGT